MDLFYLFHTTFDLVGTLYRLTENLTRTEPSLRRRKDVKRKKNKKAKKLVELNNKQTNKQNGRNPERSEPRVTCI